MLQVVYSYPLFLLYQLVQSILKFVVSGIKFLFNTITQKITQRFNQSPALNSFSWETIPVEGVHGRPYVVYNVEAENMTSIFYNGSLIKVQQLKNFVGSQVKTSKGLTIFETPQPMTINMGYSYSGYGGVYRVDGIKYTYFIHTE